MAYYHLIFAKTKPMTLLYFHGLDSQLSTEKRSILEKFATVLAPDIDYRTRPNAIAEILAEYRDVTIDAVIGSSMGGFVGYHVSQALNMPALLFNPAFPYRSVPMVSPEVIPEATPYCQIYVGDLDTVVNAHDNLTYIEHHLDRPNLELIWKLNLGHQIPVDVFESAVEEFMQKYK